MEKYRIVQYKNNCNIFWWVEGKYLFWWIKLSKFHTPEGAKRYIGRLCKKTKENIASYDKYGNKLKENF